WRRGNSCVRLTVFQLSKARPAPSRKMRVMTILESPATLNSSPRQNPKPSFPSFPTVKLQKSSVLPKVEIDSMPIGPARVFRQENPLGFHLAGLHEIILHGFRAIGGEGAQFGFGDRLRIEQLAFSRGNELLMFGRRQQRTNQCLRAFRHRIGVRSRLPEI